MPGPTLPDGILPGLPAGRIRARYAAAPGNEVESGKFLNPESSAALAANTFGFFLDKPMTLPPLPIGGDLDWQPLALQLEVENRFPWSGGHHPWLDVVVETATAVVGIESKRYEPFRKAKAASISDAYWRDVWGDQMKGYCQVRDELRAQSLRFKHLDAAQLIKHAFGLRTTVHRRGNLFGRAPVLLYLYAEPASWPDGRPIPRDHIESHRAEIKAFSERVTGDEVRFVTLSYRALLKAWRETGDVAVRAHVEAIEVAFAP